MGCTLSREIRNNIIASHISSPLHTASGNAQPPQLLERFPGGSKPIQNCLARSCKIRCFKIWHNLARIACILQQFLAKCKRSGRNLASNALIVQDSCNQDLARFLAILAVVQDFIGGGLTCKKPCNTCARSLAVILHEVCKVP